VQGNVEVVVFPRIAGVQWSNTVGSTLWGLASGVVDVLDIVLGLAEIAPASCQPQQVAWSSRWGVQSSRCGVVVLRGPCRSGSCTYSCSSSSRARGGHGPPGRSAGACTKEVRESHGDLGPLEGGGPGLRLLAPGTSLRGARGYAGPLPKQEAGPGPYVR
jgi:hypothetical protein